MSDRYASPESVQGTLAEARYFADEGLATAIFLSEALGKPLLLEGEPGVGKTEVARALATTTRRELIRLQCYEGLDASQALYEWNYARQLLQLRASERADGALAEIYTPEFLLERPLLRALRVAGGAVILIDEIDRADAEFEAFLLEFLSDFQITIPELGTVRAEATPMVILTSNRTRELHDALKRRCMYHWIDFPEPQRERRIVSALAPGVTDAAAAALVAAVARVRELPLLKKPGIAETVEWARGARILEERGAAWPAALRRSLGLLLKDEEDLARVAAEADDLLALASP
ncbi:MAG: MoxR family ATPase [Thermomicrobiales bacterium]|nr:MoxR family ATPase [Thermomicrobiales bacterium]